MLAALVPPAVVTRTSLEPPADGVVQVIEVDVLALKAVQASPPTDT